MWMLKPTSVRETAETGEAETREAKTGEANAAGKVAVAAAAAAAAALAVIMRAATIAPMKTETWILWTSRKQNLKYLGSRTTNSLS